MIDLSVFGIDTQTAVAIFLTVLLSEVIKKEVDKFNLKFEKSLFKHWNVLMPIILSSIAAFIINIDYFSIAGYLKSWAYVFAFSVVMYETIVRRFKSRKNKSSEDSLSDGDILYSAPTAQEPTVTPSDINCPCDGGK